MLQITFRIQAITTDGRVVFDSTLGAGSFICFWLGRVNTIEERQFTETKEIPWNITWKCKHSSKQENLERIIEIIETQANQFLLRCDLSSIGLFHPSGWLRWSNPRSQSNLDDWSWCTHACNEYGEGETLFLPNDLSLVRETREQGKWREWRWVGGWMGWFIGYSEVPLSRCASHREYYASWFCYFWKIEVYSIPNL